MVGKENPGITPASEEGAAWSIFGYLLAGLGIWGGIGYGLDRWWHVHFLLPAGLLLGAGASIYLVWLRYGRE